MNSITNSYYAPPAPTQQYRYPISGSLGFLINIPVSAPVSTPWYFGENPIIDNERREFVLDSFPEYHAVGGTVPYLTETMPLVDMSDPAYRYDRSKRTFRV